MNLSLQLLAFLAVWILNIFDNFFGFNDGSSCFSPLRLYSQYLVLQLKVFRRLLFKLRFDELELLNLRFEFALLISDAAGLPCDSLREELTVFLNFDDLVLVQLLQILHV